MSKSASFTVETIDPKFDDWDMNVPDKIIVAVTVEYSDDYDDGQLSLSGVTLEAKGFTPSELRSVISDSTIVDGILAFEAREISANARAVPGVLEMLAVTEMHGVVKDAVAFNSAARNAFEALGSVQKIFLAITAAQATDLRLDDRYGDLIREAVKCEL